MPISPQIAHLNFLTDQILINGDEFLQALASRGCPPPLRLRAGLTIYHDWPVDPVFLLFQEIFLFRCYVGDEFYTPQPNHMVLDVGANIGVFAIYLSSIAPGIHVDCYEPSPVTCEKLNVNIKANRLERRVVSHQSAIWRDDSSQMLLDYQSSGRKSFFDDTRETKKLPAERVACVTLATAIQSCSAKQIDFLKIDAEGAELEIVESGSKEAWSRINKVALEYHEELRPGVKDKIVNFLRKIGFKYVVAVPDPLTKSDAIGIIRAARV